MKRLAVVPLLLWAAVGCEHHPIVDRLDCANYQLDCIHQRLVEANVRIDETKKTLAAKVDESNAINTANGGKLDTANKSLDTANKSLDGANAKLDEANKELAAIEKSVKDATTAVTEVNKSVGDSNKSLTGIDSKVNDMNKNLGGKLDELIKRSPPPKP
jgi:septal ring factor EnvC (AmiA/AmiB activator)